MTVAIPRSGFGASGWARKGIPVRSANAGGLSAREQCMRRSYPAHSCVLHGRIRLRHDCVDFQSPAIPPGSLRSAEVFCAHSGAWGVSSATSALVLVGPRAELGYGGRFPVCLFQRRPDGEQDKPAESSFCARHAIRSAPSKSARLSRGARLEEGGHLEKRA
jgi:hypothetical protein